MRVPEAVPGGPGADGLGPPDAVAAAAGPGTGRRRVLRNEVLLVLAVSLGASAVAALISFAGDLTAPQRLASQRTLVVPSAAPGRPWLDLAWQLYGLATALVPVALVAHLLARGGESLGTLGLDRRRWRFDLLRGAVLAAVIGGSGLALYLAAHALGVSLQVVPTNLPHAWWRYPVLVGYAAQNAVLEEAVVLGYLTHRLDQLGWSDRRSTTASALLRGSYHLYQGIGGFAGNVVMGVIFCRLYRRWGRVMPMVVAHTLIDTVAFAGFALFGSHLGGLLPHA